MRIKEVEALLTSWFISCLSGSDFPNAMVDQDFSVEDGMSFEEYRNYEVNNFKEVSSKFDLDENLYAKVKSWFSLDDINKSHVLVYVFNKEGRFTFKVNMTVAYKEHGYVISSNCSSVQIVPKYVLTNDKINGIGLAVLPGDDFVLKSIFCDRVSFDGLTETPSFMDENFYSARFQLPESFEVNKDNILDFKLFLDDIKKNKMVIVNKKVILDSFNPEHKPFIIKEDSLILLDEKYPVSLSYIKDEKMELIEYPRNVSVNLNHYLSLTVTDAQDNDWIIK